jgi:hypothetical protein
LLIPQSNKYKIPFLAHLQLQSACALLVDGRCVGDDVELVALVLELGLPQHHLHRRRVLHPEVFEPGKWKIIFVGFMGAFSWIYGIIGKPLLCTVQLMDLILNMEMDLVARLLVKAVLSASIDQYPDRKV